MKSPFYPAGSLAGRFPLLLSLAFLTLLTSCKEDPAEEIPGKIMYGTAASGLWELILPSGNTRRLADGKSLARWSPDGNRIPWEHIDQLDRHIQIVDLNGNLLHDFVDEKIKDACWSPDGTEIAVLYAQDRCVVRINLTTLDKDTIGGLPDFWMAHPDWSPDGSALAFDALNQIWKLALDGSGLLPLTNHGNTAAEPRWSPDGNRIAYTSHSFPHYGAIYIVNADGTGNHLAIPNSGRARWSEDGKSIMYSVSNVPNGPAPVHENEQIWLRELATGTETLIREEAGLRELMDWYPKN